MALAGRIIDGRYVVEAELGSGGMGVVLKVRHRFTGAQHALKMLRPDFALDGEAQTRFLAEARAATAIGHHGIVQVLDAGKTPEGELYIVMELLSGQPLRNALARTGIAPAQLRTIGLELLDALGAAHARGFVHRDLKPENVYLVAPNGTAKLLDFGIAKMAESINMTSAPRTAAGVVLGTLAYMAPEQLHDARSVDPRADLWALGVMFFEMLSGRLPWTARTMTELYIALESEEPMKIEAVMPTASPPIIAFFARALARDPKHRFQTTAEMAAALAALPLVGPAVASGARPNIGVVSTMASADTSYPPQPVAAQQTPAPYLAQQPQPYPPQTPYPPQLQPQTPYPPRQPPPPTTPPPIAPTLNASAPSGHGSKTLLAVGLAVVAIGLIVTAVVIATRSSNHASVDVSENESKPLPEKHIVKDVGQDITPPRPADPPPAVVEDPKPPPPAPKPPPPKPRPPVAPTQPVQPAQPAQPTEPMIGGLTHDGFCQMACIGANKCGIGGASCMANCVFTEQSIACVKRAQNCNDLSGCVFQASCNAFPSGGGRCGEAITCMSGCGNSNMCGCQCARAMSINHAQLLLQLDQCLLGCGGNQQCVQQRCSGLGAQCVSQ